MDSDRGINEDPLSLHKYLYAENGPVNGIDPSGHGLADLGAAMTIMTAIGMWTSVVANYALGHEQTYSSILEGGAAGALFIPIVALAPEAGVVIGGFGIYGSSSIAFQIYNNPNATDGQKAAAIGLVVASIWGTKIAVDYANATAWKPPVDIPSDTPAPSIPQFPLPLKAPDGVILESAQGGLREDGVGQLPTLIEDMIAGKDVGDVPKGEVGSGPSSVIPKIAGWRDGNRYVINEGNHRMTAALEYYRQTGDPKYVFKLLDTGLWAEGIPPSVKTYKMTQ
jgi:hypothetical protein